MNKFYKAKTIQGECIFGHSLHSDGNNVYLKQFGKLNKDIPIQIESGSEQEITLNEFTKKDTLRYIDYMLQSDTVDAVSEACMVTDLFNSLTSSYKEVIA